LKNFLGLVTKFYVSERFRSDFGLLFPDFLLLDLIIYFGFELASFEEEIKFIPQFIIFVLPSPRRVIIIIELNYLLFAIFERIWVEGLKVPDF
jgi:hypothetical protein